MHLLSETLAKYGYPVVQLQSQDEFLSHAIDEVGIPAKWFTRYFPHNKVAGWEHTNSCVRGGGLGVRWPVRRDGEAACL